MKNICSFNFSFNIIITLMLLILSSCGYRLADFTASTTKNFNLPLINLEKGPRVSGEDCTFYLLGFIPIGHTVPDAKEATDQALEKANANFLLDAVWDIQNVWFVIGTQTCLTVEGTAVNVK